MIRPPSAGDALNFTEMFSIWKRWNKNKYVSIYFSRSENFAVLEGSSYKNPIQPKIFPQRSTVQVPEIFFLFPKRKKQEKAGNGNSFSFSLPRLTFENSELEREIFWTPVRKSANCTRNSKHQFACFINNNIRLNLNSRVLKRIN